MKSGRKVCERVLLRRWANIHHRGLPAFIPRDDGSEASTTSLIRDGKKVGLDVSRYFMYKRNAQTRNLLRSRKSFTFITNLIHLLLPGETQMQLNLSENLMLQFLPSLAMAMPMKAIEVFLKCMHRTIRLLSTILQISINPVRMFYLSFSRRVSFFFVSLSRDASVIRVETMKLGTSNIHQPPSEGRYCRVSTLHRYIL
mgnify:CR=1 FL=1